MASINVKFALHSCEVTNFQLPPVELVENLSIDHSIPNICVACEESIITFSYFGSHASCKVIWFVSRT